MAGVSSVSPLSEQTGYIYTVVYTVEPCYLKLPRGIEKE